MELHDEVHAFLTEFAQTWKSNDAHAVAAAFTDDGSIVNLFGERADGRESVETCTVSKSLECSAVRP